MRQEVLPPWFNDGSVGGVIASITEDFKLATDKSTSGIMALHNSISKASGKTCFLKRKEHVDFLNTLSLAAAVTHFDFICQLYDKHFVNEKATTHLVTRVLLFPLARLESRHSRFRRASRSTSAIVQKFLAGRLHRWNKCRALSQHHGV